MLGLWQIAKRAGITCWMAGVTAALVSPSSCPTVPSVTSVTSSEVYVDAAWMGFHWPQCPDLMIEGAQVPGLAGTGFGWRLHLPHRGDAVQVKEVLILPDAPAHIRSTEATRVLPDGRVAITEEEQVPQRGWLEHNWLLEPGDPTGMYRLRIFLDGTWVRDFQFEVRPTHGAGRIDPH